MKNVYILLAALGLILTACGTNVRPTTTADAVWEATAIADIVTTTQTTQAPAATAASSTASETTLSMDYENAVPVHIQLMVGILKLEGTELAITPVQAESFISLLTSLQELSSNTSATQDQIDSLAEQAQSILAEEQITAIANMHITQNIAMEWMQQQGMARGVPPQGNGNPPAQGNSPFGTPPADNPGTGPMGTPPVVGMQPNMNFVPRPLIDMLIQLMESKTTSS